MLTGKSALITGSLGGIGFATAKALAGLTRAVALEVARTDITCNAICPGTVLTPAIDRRLRQAMQRDMSSFEEAEADFLAIRQPSRRFVPDDNVAGLIAFLCGAVRRRHHWRGRADRSGRGRRAIPQQERRRRPGRWRFVGLADIGQRFGQGDRQPGDSPRRALACPPGARHWRGGARFASRRKLTRINEVVGFFV